jgi:hypothetical protein
MRDSAGALSTLVSHVVFEWFYRGLPAQLKFSIAVASRAILRGNVVI